MKKAKKILLIVLCSVVVLATIAGVIVGIVFSRPASIIAEYEKERAKEIASLKEKMPGYIVEADNRAGKVQVIFLFQSGSSMTPKKFAKKYALKTLFPKAEIEVSEYGIITLNFKRNDYTKAAHWILTTISEKAASVYPIHPHVYAASSIKYKPDISLYAENPTKIEHAYPNRRQENLNLPESDEGVHDVGRIITTKAEYDAYIGLFAENYDYYPEGLEILEYKKSLYDEEFFKTNALLVTKKVVRDELGYRMGVSDVYLSDNKIYVVICRFKPEGLSVGMIQNPFYITVSKDAINGATELITLD